MKRLANKKTVSPVGTYLEKSNTKYSASLIRPLLTQGLGAIKKDTVTHNLAYRLKYVKQKSITEGNSLIGAEPPNAPDAKGRGFFLILVVLQHFSLLHNFVAAFCTR